MEKYKSYALDSGYSLQEAKKHFKESESEGQQITDWRLFKQAENKKLAYELASTIFIFIFGFITGALVIALSVLSAQGFFK